MWGVKDEKKVVGSEGGREGVVRSAECGGSGTKKYVMSE